MKEDENFEKKISGNGNPISLVLLEKLIPKGKNCICKIFYKGFATGFFCKIPIYYSSQKFAHVLFTNNHVLDDKFLRKEKEIDIIYQIQKI
jgi:hypothetical protein